MLEKVNLDLTLSRARYDRALPALQRRLYDLHKACWDAGVASIAVFEGWEAAGKGSAISELTARMDPRGFKLHAIQEPRTYEKQRPWLWRFWLRTPNRGEMAIFDRSWYCRVLDERMARQISREECQRALLDIAEFERLLADEGVAIVKFWFHISKKEQKKRFRAIEADPLESWRLADEHWKQNKRAQAWLEAVEEMLQVTETEWAPWTIVEATSKWYARHRVFETVIGALERRLHVQPSTGAAAGRKRRPRAAAGDA